MHIFQPNLPSGYKESRLCPKLRELIVTDTKVRSIGVYYALKYLTNLESLGSCYHVASGIKKHVIESLCGFKLKEVRYSPEVRFLYPEMPIKSELPVGLSDAIAEGTHLIVPEGVFLFAQAHTRGITKDKIILLCSHCPNLEKLFISSGSNPHFTFKVSLSVLLICCRSWIFLLCSNFCR